MNINEKTEELIRELISAISAEKTWMIENTIESFQEDEDYTKEERKKAIFEISTYLTNAILEGKITKGKEDAERIQKILKGKL